MTPQAPPKVGPLTRRIEATRKPEPWKPAWLRKGTHKDMTGRVMLP